MIYNCDQFSEAASIIMGKPRLFFINIQFLSDILKVCMNILIGFDG